MSGRDNLGLALSAAREYATVVAREGSNHARCRQLANDIDWLAGRWHGGKLVLPAAVRSAMLGTTLR